MHPLIEYTIAVRRASARLLETKDTKQAKNQIAPPTPEAKLLMPAVAPKSSQGTVREAARF
jgi:hypothetical protein